MKPRYRGPDAGVLYALTLAIPIWAAIGLAYWWTTR